MPRTPSPKVSAGIDAVDWDVYNDVQTDLPTASDDELTQYLAEPPVPIKKDAQGKPLPFNPIHWWRDNAYMFPTLRQMAMDHFACPAMSSECERAFSVAGQVINEHRPRTLDEFAQAQQCLKAWIANQLVDLNHSLGKKK